MPPHILKIKIGAVYMLLRNLNIKKGLCNGSRIEIKSISPRLISYDLLNNDGSVREENILLPKITLTPTEGYPFVFQRTQYPIIPAYAATINKSQGCTFERIGIDLTEPCFSHGQLYVALSRARNFDRITVLLPQDEFSVPNIVWKQILQNTRIDHDIQNNIEEFLINEDNSHLDPLADLLMDDDSNYMQPHYSYEEPMSGEDSNPE